MRIVDHHERVVSVGQIADAAQVRDGAIHGKHAVGGDQPGARALALPAGSVSSSAMSLLA